MNFSKFHVWAIVLLSTDMQNKVVNKFRRRLEAEECLRLLRRSNPNKTYEIMYAPPEKSLINPVESQPVSSNDRCVQATNKGSATMEIVWHRPEHRQPQETNPVLGIYTIDGEPTTQSVCLGFSGVWWIDGYKSIDPPLWWAEIPLPTTE